jgi:hypothetical protein
MAVNLALCVPATSRAEYVSKTFCATFDDGTVITGAFAGDTGEDQVLDVFFDAEINEVDQFTMDVYVTNPDFQDQGAEWFTGSWSASDDLLYWFSYNPENDALGLIIVDWPASLRGILLESVPERGMRYLAVSDAIGFSGNTYFGTELTGDSWVTITDATESFTFDTIADHIAAGLAVGAIDNKGIAQSLLTMVDAAGSAAENNRTKAAAGILGAFVHRVEAQSGQHLSPLMAQLLLDDAAAALESLGNDK